MTSLAAIPTSVLRAEIVRRAKTAPDPMLFRAAVLVGAAASVYAASPSDVSSPSKERHLVRARWAVFATLRGQGHSFSRIARIFKMDHGTVIHGCRSAAALGSRCERFRAALAACAGCISAAGGLS